MASDPRASWLGFRSPALVESAESLEPESPRGIVEYRHVALLRFRVCYVQGDCAAALDSDGEGTVEWSRSSETERRRVATAGVSRASSRRMLSESSTPGGTISSAPRAYASISATRRPGVPSVTSSTRDPKRLRRALQQPSASSAAPERAPRLRDRTARHMATVARGGIRRMERCVGQPDRDGPPARRLATWSSPSSTTSAARRNGCVP